MGSDEKRKIGFWNILGWLLGLPFGFLFILAGIYTLIDGSILSGLFLVLVGLIIFPPFYIFLKKGFGVNSPAKKKIVGSFILLVLAGGMFLPSEPEPSVDAARIMAMTPPSTLQILTPVFDVDRMRIQTLPPIKIKTFEFTKIETTVAPQSQILHLSWEKMNRELSLKNYSLWLKKITW